MPDSTTRMYWDCAVLCLLLYTIIVLPIRVAFSAADQQVDPIDVFVDVLFFVDIIVSFFSAYKTAKGTVVTDPRKITQSYLSSWFIADVLGTFPFYLISSGSITRLSGILRIPRLLKVLKLVRLVKLVRTYRLQKFFEAVEYSPRIHQGLIRIVKLLFIILAFAHFSACLWYFTGDVMYDVDDPYTRSWIARTFHENEHAIIYEKMSRRYIVSVYWAISGLTTVGFGDVVPQENLELVFTILLMITGATTFSYITATVSSVLHDYD